MNRALPNNSKKEKRPGYPLSPFRIAAIYATIGGLWILFSDSLLAMLVTDPATITRVSIYKGWAYVLVTALLLYWLVRRYVAEQQETVSALSESKHYNRALFEHSPIGLALCRVDGKFVDINSAYARILGRTVEETLKLSYWDITPGKYSDQEAVQLESLMGTSRYGPYEKEYIHKDGHLVPICLAGVIIEQGGEKLILSSVEDITERKKAEKRLRRMNRTLYAISRCNEIVAHAGKEQKMMNDICRSIITAEGYRFAWIGFADHDEQKTVRPVAQAGFEEGYLEKVHITWADTDRGRGPTGTAVRTGKPFFCRHILTDLQFAPWRADAVQRGYASSIALPLILNNHPFGALSIYAEDPDAFDEEEVTMLSGMMETLAFGIGSLRTRAERIKAESELVKYREHLEELVKERTAALQESQRTLMNIVEDLKQKKREMEAANDKLKELDRLKSMFIATMSHELRTPLNSIIGFTGIILQGMTGEITAEQRDQLQRVSRAGKHLLALITDVIDISKIEAGKIDVSIEEFSLETVLNEAVSTLKTQISEKGLDLEVSMIPREIVMKSDRKRLYQSVLNYLSNAVKFTGTGKISLVAEKKDDMIVIQVADNGIGIKEEDIPKLFQSFVRLESSLTSTSTGTGLGLYLTRKLVTEVLGGTVSVTSRYGQGSTFTMKIPAIITNREVRSQHSGVRRQNE